MNKFIKNYRITSQEENRESVGWNSFIENYDFVKPMFEELGGSTFGNGIFRIHTKSTCMLWTNLLVQEYFKEELKQTDLICFGFNWQGIMYFINSNNNEIVYFDPATCEFFTADNININEFFDDTLLDTDYDLLSADYFEDALNFLEIVSINFNESIGHKIYLHLGGKDEVDNLEIMDTEVLWETQIQVANDINEIPD